MYIAVTDSALAYAIHGKWFASEAYQHCFAKL